MCYTECLLAGNASEPPASSFSFTVSQYRENTGMSALRSQQTILQGFLTPEAAYLIPVFNIYRSILSPKIRLCTILSVSTTFQLTAPFAGVFFFPLRLDVTFRAASTLSTSFSTYTTP